MKRPKFSTPLTVLIWMSLILGSILPQWMILAYYFNVKDSSDLVAASFFLISPNCLLWLLVFFAYRKRQLQIFTSITFFLGIAGVACIGMAGIVLERVFAQAREKERPAACMSNLQQISRGTGQYLQDYDEVMPPAPKWAASTAVYVDKPADNSVWHCPSATTPYSYALNRGVTGVFTAEADPREDIITLFESDAAIWNVIGGKENLPKPGQHTKGGMFAFLDGHVKYLSDDTVRRDTSILWNIPKTTNE